MRHSFRYPLVKLALALAVSTCALPVAAELAEAQTIEFSTQVRETYAGVPFQLSIVLKDFEENPTPEIAPFEIENADVQLIGVSPSVSSMSTFINGKWTTKRDVSFVFSYNILPKKPGQYVLPQIKAVQQGKEVVSNKRVSFEAIDVENTRDMRIELELPQRALWVSESFEVTLNWYVRKDFSTHSFEVPMLSMGDYFDISEPDVAPRERTLTLNVGGRQMQFPYTRDNVRAGGLDYTRFRIKMNVTPIKSGTIQVPPTTVHAELEAGMTRDGWGFPSTQYKLYKAEDTARTLTIKELPAAQRPASFSNALGESFDIAVTADRTIVKVGDPVELTIDISSNSVLDGLILPNLNQSGLNEALFTVSNESPIPETIDGGNGRTIWRFKVPVRIKSERVREVPPIAFSYFDPSREVYQTVRSQPIALSVSDAEKIGVNDIVMNPKTAGATVAATAKKQGDDEAPQIAPDTFMANSGLSLGLMSNEASLNSQVGRASMRAIEIAAYASPFVIWLLLVATRRAKKRSDRDKPQREAAIQLKNAMADAKNLSSRDAAARISNALSAFTVATETDKKLFQDVVENMEAEAYRPNAQSAHLDEKILTDLRESVKKHVNPKYTKLISGIFALCFAFGLAVMSPDNAQADDGVPSNTNVQAQSAASEQMAAPVAGAAEAADKLANAKKLYHQAMSERDPAKQKQRLRDFNSAAHAYRQLSEMYPQNAALCFDWGNAAFNAKEYGSASLAWRRALLLDPTLSEARANLAYLDSLQNVAPKDENRAFSSFFFLNDKVSADTRLLWASLFFFVGLMLCIPWRESTRRILRYLAVLPLVCWAWLLLSVAMAPSHANDAVVMHETVLRNADNAGAAALMTLQPGAFVTINDVRGDWTMVVLPNDVQAWVTSSSIERVQIR